VHNVTYPPCPVSWNPILIGLYQFLHFELLLPSICGRGLQVFAHPLHHKFHNCLPIPKWCVSNFHFCFICYLSTFLDASTTQGWFLSYTCCGHGFKHYYILGKTDVLNAVYQVWHPLYDFIQASLWALQFLWSVFSNVNSQIKTFS